MGVFTKLTKAALVALIAMAQVLTIMAQEYGFGEIQEYSTYEKGEMLHDSYNYIDD